MEDREFVRDDGEGGGQSRREFIGALGGALGAVALSDSSALAAALGGGGPQLPDGYTFHRIFTVGEGTKELGDVAEVMQGVMINDRSEVIFHAKLKSGARAVYRLPISRDRRPRIERPRLIVQTGQEIAPGFVAERIAAGDTNNRGTYATVVRGAKELNRVFVQRRGRPLRQLLAVGGRTPGKGDGRWSGSFGDIDIDAYDTITLSARYSLPGKVEHGLFLLPGGKRQNGRVLIKSGDRIPNSRASVTGFGLVERRGPFYVVQVYGRQGRHRRRQDLPIEPSGFLIGRVDAGRREQRLLAGAKLLGIQGSVIQGDAIIGPRVHRDGTAATVVHRRGAHLQLHRRAQGRRAEKLAESGDLGAVRGSQVRAVSAPLFGPDGLLLYRTIGKRSMRVIAATESERRTILEAGDRVDGRELRVINLGWHTDQIDSKGRIAFQAELDNGRTAIVIGTPV